MISNQSLIDNYCTWHVTLYTWPAVKWFISFTIFERTGGTKIWTIFFSFEDLYKWQPITSRMTEVVWGCIRALLSAVQVTWAPWSDNLRPEMMAVLVTRPLMLSTSCPTADTGTPPSNKIHDGLHCIDFAKVLLISVSSLGLKSKIMECMQN